MPRFGPQPKFEPEPGRTGPRSGLKVQASGRTGPMVRFEVQRMTGFCRTGLNPSEPNLSYYGAVRGPKKLPHMLEGPKPRKPVKNMQYSTRVSRCHDM